MDATKSYANICIFNTLIVLKCKMKNEDSTTKTVYKHQQTNLSGIPKSMFDCFEWLCMLRIIPVMMKPVLDFTFYFSLSLYVSVCLYVCTSLSLSLFYFPISPSRSISVCLPASVCLSLSLLPLSYFLISPSGSIFD